MERRGQKLAWKRIRIWTYVKVGHFRYDLKQIRYDCTVEVRNRFKELDQIDRVSDELYMNRGL